MNTLLNSLAPTQAKETLTIRLPQDALLALNEVCQLPQIGVSKNALARVLIIQGIEKLKAELSTIPATPIVPIVKVAKQQPTNSNKSLSLNAELAAIYGKDKLSNNACSEYVSEARQALGIEKSDNSPTAKQRIIEWHKNKQA